MLLLAACGSTAPHRGATTAGRTPTPPVVAPPVSTRKTPPPAVDELPAAERPTTAEFPAVDGRSLFGLEQRVRGVAQLVAATGSFTPGERRYAFGLVTSAGAFVYAPTALYIAPDTGRPVQGPFLAAADPMSVAARYSSSQNAGPFGIKAIYGTEVPLPHPGTYSILALTRAPVGLLESVGEIAVAASSPIPAVGQRPPDIATDTLASVHGDIGLITTRIPPEHMNAVSFNAALGRRPIALLFSTPALCISRVCGPVTDILVALQHEFGRRIVFIHQEIYADNDPVDGFRPQVRAFHLETEPWLFVINRQGVITARIEGAFGVNTARRALESGLA